MLARYIDYANQRFPLIPLALHCGLAALVLATSAGSGMVPALANGLVYLLFLLHMRVLDEHKDKAFDDTNYPDRPVQTGAVSLAELRHIGWVNFGLMALLVLTLWPPLGWAVFVAVTGYAFLMYREFFIPRFWERAPALYLFSHQVVLVLLFFGFLAARIGQAPLGRSVAAVGFVYVSVLNIELGRKVQPRYNPAGELTGDTYAAVWGTRFTLRLIAGMGGLAFLLAWTAGGITATGLALGLGLYAAYLLASLLFPETLVAHSREVTFVATLVQLVIYLGAQP